jgi:hypothetical protein
MLMCEPISISAGAAWVLGATAAVGVATAVYTADKQKKEGRANAEIAENNAQLADQQAKNASAMGDREAEQAAWRNRALMGQQRAAIASKGIDSAIGTPAELLGETALFGEADQQNIRLNAAQNAWGFRAQAGDFRNRGAISKWSGKAQATGTLLSGLGSAMGSVSGMYG